MDQPQKATIADIIAQPDSREGVFDRASANKEKRTVELSFSSEAPVERWYGTEILSHDATAVNLDRMASGRANLLVNHDPNDWVGVIETARIDGDRKGRAVVRFGNSARAAEIFRDVTDGILTSVSVGYMRDEMKLSRTGKDQPDEYTVTRWTPFEASLVTVPADTNVGVGRAAEVKTAVPNPPAQAANTIEVIKMTEAEKLAAQKAAEAEALRNLSAVQIEKDRAQAIRNLVEANNLDTRLGDKWVMEGTQITDVAKEILDIMVERSKNKPMTAAALGLSSKETQQYSLFRAIRALKFGGQYVEHAGFEMECSRAVAQKLGRQLTTNILIPAEVLTRPVGEAAAQRAMATTPGSKGGYMVNVDNMGFIDILRNRSVAMNMGARVLPGLQGNVTFTRQTGKGTVTWQGGEGVSVTATDQALGQLSMTPKTAICITDVSEQLLAQSSPSAEAFVMADLAKDIAIDGVDNAVINGTGGAQPLGIKNHTGVTTGQDAGTATYAKILAFPGVAAGVNAIRENPGFVTNSAGAIVLMQRFRVANTDTPLWEGNIMDGSCVGFRAMSSEQLASGNLIFGSWGDVLIGEWGVLELAMDNGGTRFNAAQVGIRAMWMVDVLLRYPQGFVVSTSLS